jgi:hypothetical protein
MDGVGVAGFAGQRGRAGAAVQVDLVKLHHHRRAAERHGGAIHAEDHIDATPVEPLAHEADREIGLVLAVGDEHLHGDAGIGFGKFAQGLDVRRRRRRVR